MDADRILREVLSLPTAPFHEERVAAWILRFAQARRVPARMDGAGNVVLQVTARGSRPYTHQHGRNIPAVAFVAHMDHPGFEVRRARGRTAELEIHGGAPRAMIGAHVRVFGQTGDGMKAMIAGAERVSRGMRRVHAICGTGGFQTRPYPSQFAMWHLPPFRRAGNRVRARAIDDLAGCAAILAAVDRVWKGGFGRRNLSGGGRQSGPEGPSCTLACFTRAEEVGFVGATALAKSGLIPRNAIVVSVEMSRMLPGAEQGKGPVVRVGDRRSIFDPDATQAMADVAAGLAMSRKGFRFQKRILDGGTCEATVIRALGYRATGLACPLGNYHNLGPDGVRPEYIDIRDWRNLVELIATAARELPGAVARQGATRERVLGLYRAYRGKL